MITGQQYKYTLFKQFNLIIKYLYQIIHYYEK